MKDFRDLIFNSEKLLDLIESGSAQFRDEDMLLIPALLMSWIAMEAFVNDMIEDFNQVPADLFTLHEKAFLLEKKVRFCDHGSNLGKFVIDNTNEYRSLDDKIFFLISKFGNFDSSFKGNRLWQDFERFKEIRDSIVHPKKYEEMTLSIDMAKQNIEIAKSTITLIAKHVWKKDIHF
jgi:hypothetical protein